MPLRFFSPSILRAISLLRCVCRQDRGSEEEGRTTVEVWRDLLRATVTIHSQMHCNWLSEGGVVRQRGGMQLLPRRSTSRDSVLIASAALVPLLRSITARFAPLGFQSVPPSPTRPHTPPTHLPHSILCTSRVCPSFACVCRCFSLPASRFRVVSGQECPPDRHRQTENSGLTRNGSRC